MKITINTRNHGQVTFSRPGGSYIFTDLLNGKPGTMGHQICEGGHLSGDTISYGGEDLYEFAEICRRWWKSYLRKEREFAQL